jgi:small-conductance mechanosensitive channel
LQGRILKRFDIDPGIQFTLARITQYVIVVIGILISFQFLEINLTSLAVIFGLLSVGIGFGLQNITANFISGLIIMFERPITVGDRVEVGDKEGDVIEINIRSTKIRTLNNISIIVPNTQFVENDVINYSHGDSTFRLDITVGVAYSSNLDTVLKALNEVADEHPKVMKYPRHQVHLTEFGDSAWEMQLRVWIPNVKERYILRNELNQAIVRKFEEMKVEIPFPQRDLHLRSSIDLPVNTRFNKEENPGS